MNELIAAIASESLLYFTTAVVLAVGGREFRLFNLAGGVWIIVGGWLFQYARSSLAGMEQGRLLNPEWFFVLLAIAVIQAALVRVAGRGLIRSPLSYLFLSLGIAVTVSAIGTNQLLVRAGHSINQAPTLFGWLFFLGACVAAVTVSWSLFQSGWWARTVLCTRIGDNPSGSTSLALFVLIEVVLLIFVGAAAGGIHRGVFGSAEYRTVIPILALVAAGGRIWKAGVLSGAVVLAGHVLTLASPGAAVVSKAIAISLLLVLVLKKAMPRRPLVSASKVHVLAPALPFQLANTETPWRAFLKSKAAAFLFVASAISALPFLLVIIESAKPGFVSSHDVFQFSLMLALVVGAWLGQRFLGLFTLSWPMLSVIFIYLPVALRWESPAIIFGWLGALVVSILLLWVVRVLPAEAALIFDLGVVVCAHQWLKSTPGISGGEEVILVSLPLSVQPLSASLVLGMVLGGLFCLALFLSSHRIGRAITAGLANFISGRYHGVPVVTLYSVLAAVLVAAATAATYIFHLNSPAVSVSEGGLERGITVFLLAYLMFHAGPVAAAIVVLLIFLVLPTLFVGSGSLFAVSIGVALILAAYLVRPKTNLGEGHA